MLRKITAKLGWWFGGSLLIFCLSTGVVMYSAPHTDRTLDVYPTSIVIKLGFALMLLSGLSIPISVIGFYITQRKMKISCLMLAGGLVFILFMLTLAGPSVGNYFTIYPVDALQVDGTTYYAAEYSVLYNSSYSPPQEVLMYRCNALGFQCQLLHRAKPARIAGDWDSQSNVQLFKKEDSVSLVIEGETIFTYSKSNAQ